MTESELSLLGRVGAHASWANTKDRTARTAPARAALDAKFLAEADGDPKRAESLRKLYYSRLALKSARPAVVAALAWPRLVMELTAPPDFPSGVMPDPSNTARPAENRTNTPELDPALVRRTVTALTELAEAAGRPMRRKQARLIVVSYASSHGPELDGWSHWLQNWLGISDPTAESVVRNVTREGR